MRDLFTSEPHHQYRLQACIFDKVFGGNKLPANTKIEKFEYPVPKKREKHKEINGGSPFPQPRDFFL